MLNMVVCTDCHVHEYYRSRHPLETTMGGERTRAKFLASVVRGRQRVLGLRKRASTRQQYQHCIANLAAFMKEHGLRVEWMDHEVLMDYVVWLLAARQLDSTTVRLSVGAVHDFFEYVRNDLGLHHIPNPARHPTLREFSTAVGANYKKPSRARLSVTLAHAKRLLAVGFVGESRKARHARLFYIFLTLGMLRNTAACHLKVVYEVDPTTSLLRLSPESDVQIERSDEGEYLKVRVDVDKNVTAETVRHAYIPANRFLDVNPVHEFSAYLKEIRPPTGGFLFAEPYARNTNFSPKVFKGFGKLLKAAFLKAFPDAEPAFVSRLGSHSGRKSLAQWLWEAGWSKRLIADAGGWFVKREAVDLYFSTSPTMIIKAIKTLGSAPLCERISND